MSEYVYDPMFWVNAVCVIGSITALHLISGKTNNERNTGFWMTIFLQPLFFFLGIVITVIFFLPTVLKNTKSKKSDVS